MKRVSAALGRALLIWNLPTIAQQQPSCTGAQQAGTWTLQSWVAEDLETGQKSNPFGERPNGYISYGPDCRMYAILVKDNRKAPAALVPTDAEKIDLYAGVIAYAGTYTLDGNKVSHHIDISWNQVWTGTTQVREFKVEGNTLYIRAAPAKSPLTGRRTVFSLVYNKVE